MDRLKVLFFRIGEPTSKRNISILSSIMVLFVFVLAVSYGYFDFLLLPPKGLHFIRQTDSLSFSSTFFHHHNAFIHPQIYNLTSTNGNAACEFPILYYLQAQLYKIFGENYWIARGSSLLIVVTGYVLLFKSLIKDSQSWLISIITIIASTSSAVILFYSINFLPDSAAFGFCLIGISFMIQGKNFPSKKYFYLAFLFFMCSGLIKITYLIYPIAYTVNEIIQHKLKLKTESKSSSPVMLTVALAASCLLLVSIWFLYANGYNKENGSNYFMMQSSPYWQLNLTEKSAVWDHIRNYWNVYFYYPTVQHLFLIVSLLALTASILKKSKINFLIVLLICGNTSYFLLFFQKFKDHDYYILTVMPTLLLIFYYAQLEIKNWKTYKVIGPLLILSSLTISLLSLNYGLKKCNQRFHATDLSNLEAPTNLFNGEVVKKLQQIISESESVLVIGDLTPNATLFYLKRNGYSTSNNPHFQLMPQPKACANFILLLPGNSISEDIKNECHPQLLNSFDGIEIYSVHYDG
jgi:hypothetical protein